MRLHTALTRAARRLMTASVAAIPADGVTMRRPMGIATHMAAAHPVVPGMDMIAVHMPAMLEITATLSGATGVGIRETSADANADHGADIEADSDADSEVESGQTHHAHGERRHVDFTDRQRNPADGGFRHHYAWIETGEDHQRGSIHGTNYGDRHGRHPAPRSAYRYPAAVVKRRPTPRSVIDPVPAPRLDPGPVTIAVRRPVARHAGGKPHGAVGIDAAPHAKLGTEVGIAGKIARDVTRGHGGHFTCIAKGAKCVELVRRRQRMRIERRAFTARGRHLRAHVHRRRLVPDVDFRLAGAHRGDGGVAVFVDVHPVIAIAQQREGELRSIDLEAFPGTQRVQPDAHRSGGELDLRHVIVEIQERKIGTGAHADRRIIGLQFRDAVRFRPDMIAIGHRMIELRRNPIVDGGGLKRYGARGVA
jgi:hypothetical protein